MVARQLHKWSFTPVSLYVATLYRTAKVAGSPQKRVTALLSLQSPESLHIILLMLKHHECQHRTSCHNAVLAFLLTGVESSSSGVRGFFFVYTTPEAVFLVSAFEEKTVNDKILQAAMLENTTMYILNIPCI